MFVPLIHHDMICYYLRPLLYHSIAISRNKYVNFQLLIIFCDIPHFVCIIYVNSVYILVFLQIVSVCHSFMKFLPWSIRLLKSFFARSNFIPPIWLNVKILLLLSTRRMIRDFNIIICNLPSLLSRSRKCIECFS